MKEGNVKENKQVEEAMKTLESSVSNAKLLGRNLRITLTSNVLEIALNYIKELEEKIKLCEDTGTKLINKKTFTDNFINKQVIRDKISLFELEIETLKTLYPKSYTRDDDYKLYVYKIQALKELLEEE